MYFLKRKQNQKLETEAIFFVKQRENYVCLPDKGAGGILLVKSQSVMSQS